MYLINIIQISYLKYFKHVASNHAVNTILASELFMFQNSNKTIENLIFILWVSR